MRGILTLRVYHRGEKLSLSMSVSLHDMEELPLQTSWLVKQMDQRLYERIGHIPRERTWEVAVHG